MSDEYPILGINQCKCKVHFWVIWFALKIQHGLGQFRLLTSWLLSTHYEENIAWQLRVTWAIVRLPKVTSKIMSMNYFSKPQVLRFLDTHGSVGSFWCQHKWWPDVKWCHSLRWYIRVFFRGFSGWWNNVVPNHSQAFRDRIHLLVMFWFWCQSSLKWQTTFQINSLQFPHLSVTGHHAKLMFFFWSKVLLKRKAFHIRKSRLLVLLSRFDLPKGH